MYLEMKVECDLRSVETTELSSVLLNIDVVSLDRALNL